jgi:hypothetical protein
VALDEGAPQVRVVPEPVEAGADQAERRDVGEAGQVAQYQHHLLVRQAFHLLPLLALCHSEAFSARQRKTETLIKLIS